MRSLPSYTAADAVADVRAAGRFVFELIAGLLALLVLGGYAAFVM